MATLRLGMSSDTEDLTGTILEKVDEVHVTEEEILKVLSSFKGVISQVPPMYSAVKVDGKRLYELAREGKTVERKSREVEIYEIEMTDMTWVDNYPEITFRVLCSKGTYIRTLCVDIGRALGLPGVMVKLERTMSAGISASHCLSLEDIAAQSLQMRRSLICQSTRLWMKRRRRHFRGSGCLPVLLLQK